MCSSGLGACTLPQTVQDASHTAHEVGGAHWAGCHSFRPSAVCTSRQCRAVCSSSDGSRTASVRQPTLHTKLPCQEGACSGFASGQPHCVSRAGPSGAAARPRRPHLVRQVPLGVEQALAAARADEALGVDRACRDRDELAAHDLLLAAQALGGRHGGGCRVPRSLCFACCRPARLSAKRARPLLRFSLPSLTCALCRLCVRSATALLRPLGARCSVLWVAAAGSRVAAHAGMFSREARAAACASTPFHPIPPSASPHPPTQSPPHLVPISC